MISDFHQAGGSAAASAASGSGIVAQLLREADAARLSKSAT